MPPKPDPCLLVVAAFSRHRDALAWAREELELDYGSMALVSPFFKFNQTRYYESSMGKDLWKLFYAFRKLAAPDQLPNIKNRAIAIEHELTALGRYDEPRPLNLDPGFLTLGKFSLATTKDQAHRIYLADGIFAENTLRFHNHEYRVWPWTYADYQQPEVLQFLKKARDYYKGVLSPHLNG